MVDDLASRERQRRLVAGRCPPHHGFGNTSCTLWRNCRSDPRNICCVDDAIERVIADVRRYTEAGERLAERLHQHTRWNEEDIERLRTGTSLTESCQVTGSAQRSRDLTRILAEFEESRRVIRSSTVMPSRRRASAYRCA